MWQCCLYLQNTVQEKENKTITQCRNLTDLGRCSSKQRGIALRGLDTEGGKENLNSSFLLLTLHVWAHVCRGLRLILVIFLGFLYFNSLKQALSNPELIQLV